MAIMGRDAFWAIVDRAREGVDTRTHQGADVVAGRIGQRLAELGREAAVAFDLRYATLGVESYDMNLWGAAYVMMGGCSDDGFDYFRGWFVTQGRGTWERALRDPDTLADLGVDPDDDYLECDAILNIGQAAFGDFEEFCAAADAARAGLPPETFDKPLLGDVFDPDDDDEVRARYPRLAELYS